MCENIKYWKPINGFPGYECSSSGEFRRGNRILRQANHPKGYKNVRIYLNGKQFTFRSHRLVMQVFVGGLNGFEVNHKNGKKDDNRLENLELCSHTVNIRHAVLTGLLRHKRGKDNKLSSPIRGKHIQTGEEIFFHSQADAARAGFSQGCIQLVLTGKRPQHKGYFWEHISVPSLPGAQPRNSRLIIDKQGTRPYA